MSFNHIERKKEPSHSAFNPCRRIRETDFGKLYLLNKGMIIKLDDSIW